MTCGKRTCQELRRLPVPGMVNPLPLHLQPRLFRHAGTRFGDGESEPFFPFSGGAEETLPDRQRFGLHAEATGSVPEGARYPTPRRPRLSKFEMRAVLASATVLLAN